ncbi:hypothetical protein CH063_01775 [Colletotrichum higginsianum]|uniref:Uncharacterized protein n=1 Tax=Colletotrichum higginsianum (strain IMI 349063) TaxID=759273 RepID=H1VC32_COLHI|nr:hypothetical protein CH063_01775 [Colletotrichum higginsianum]
MVWGVRVDWSSSDGVIHLQGNIKSLRLMQLRSPSLRDISPCSRFLRRRGAWPGRAGVSPTIDECARLSA